MQVFRNQKLAKKAFTLDQCVFIDCALHGCDIYYFGGDYEWRGTTFDSCHFHWRGPARNTVQLLVQLKQLKPGESPPSQVKGSSVN